MRVVVKHLGIPLEGLDKEPFELDLEEGATIRDLVDQLMKKHPHLTPKHFQTTSFMIDGKKADYKSILKDNEKVLLMRILGGG